MAKFNRGEGRVAAKAKMLLKSDRWAKLDTNDPDSFQDFVADVGGYFPGVKERCERSGGDFWEGVTSICREVIDSCGVWSDQISLVQQVFLNFPKNFFGKGWHQNWPCYYMGVGRRERGKPETGATTMITKMMRKFLSQKGITVLGKHPITGYIINDNGTGRVVTYSELVEMAKR
jgi:hypothetical protein